MVRQGLCIVQLTHVFTLALGKFLPEAQDNCFASCTCEGFFTFRNRLISFYLQVRYANYVEVDCYLCACIVSTGRIHVIILVRSTKGD